VSLAACFYWKPVRCLQRSVAAMRLLRKCGIDGRLVIGYRPSPFFSHAWVEVMAASSMTRQSTKKITCPLHVLIDASAGVLSLVRIGTDELASGSLSFR